MSTTQADPLPDPPLDESLYSLSPDEAQIFKLQTGITDDRVLKSHILAIQKKAYNIYTYPCIRFFGFTRFMMSQSSIYPSVLKLPEVCEGAIFLDIGSAFGGDLRKLVADGWPVQNILAVDLFPDFWRIGHELFKTTPETFPVPLLLGDIFDLTAPPSQRQLDPPLIPQTDLRSLKSLVPLEGKVSVIYAGLFFHLFNEEQQHDLAHRLAVLLSPQPGSIIFGIQIGLLRSKGFRPQIANCLKFCFSPDSWRELWEERIFEKGSVKVDAELLDGQTFGYPSAFSYLQWSVVRL